MTFCPHLHLGLILNPGSLFIFFHLLPSFSSSFSPHPTRRLRIDSVRYCICQNLRASRSPPSARPVDCLIGRSALFFSTANCSRPTENTQSAALIRRAICHLFFISLLQIDCLLLNQHSAHLAVHCRSLSVYVSARFRHRIQTFLHAAVISHTAET